MNKRIVNFLLIAVIAIATFLRLWNLGTVPLSPDWDEAALGYNAYSIIQTGRDEYGKFFPVVLRSFEDYKPALYTYLTIPFVEVFGLNTFSVRLPSALFGIFSVYLIYLLVKELFRRDDLAFISAFLLSISPWHIQFSRVAFESNVGLAFNMLTVLFFIKSFKKNSFILFSAFFAGLNFYIYQSERVFTPLFIAALVVIYRKELFSVSRKYLVGAAIIGVITILPLVCFISTNPQALVRVKATSIFSNQTQLLKGTISRLNDDKTQHDIVGLVLDNRRVIYLKSFIESYIVHFDIKWLFLTKDVNRHHAPRAGQLYLFTLLFLFIGIYQLLFGEFNRKTKMLVFAWVLIAPIPASVTFEVPHSVRTLNILPALQVLIAVGIVYSYSFIARYKKFKTSILICVSVFALGNILYYFDQYFVQQNYFNAIDWQYGYEKTIPQVDEIKKNYNKIIVSDKQPMDKSYIYFLFYLKYPSDQYQRLSLANSNSDHVSHDFDKYNFKVFDWEKEKNKERTLFVGSSSDFPDNIVSIKKIYYPDGKTAMLLVDPKDNK